MDAYSKKPKPNHLLRQERLERGWTLEHAADELYKLCGSKVSVRGDINAKMIGRWERGEHLPSLFYQEKLRLLYGKPLQELGFIQSWVAGDERAEEPARAPEHLPALVTGSALQRSPVDMTPHRAVDLIYEAPHLTLDQLVSAWLALGATDLATLFDEGWTLEEVLTSLRIVLQGVQAMPNISRRTFGRRMRELIAAAVASCIPIPTGEHITVEERTHLHQALGENIAAGWQLFHTAGNAQVLAVSQAQLYLVQHTQVYLYPSIQPIFYSGVYRLMGAALFFQGRYEEAQHAQQSAYTAALEGADAWNMAQSRTWQVYGYQALGQHEQAIQAIVSALRLTAGQDDEASRRLQSHSLACCWAESAVAMREDRISQEKLEASASFLDDIHPNEEFDRSHWLQIAANCALATEDYPAAIQHLEEALVELSPNWLMRQALTTIPLAVAYARTGERNVSIDVAKKAVAVLSALNAPIMTKQLVEYLQHDLLERFPGDTYVSSFIREVGHQLPQTAAVLL
jgi:tetratricopeptide (TPR) repeat protein